jgi:hypothetical protein
MYSSQKSDIIFTVYNDQRTVFTLNDIAMLVDESDFNSLNKKIHYYVGRGKLLRPRKGIYVKKDYNPEELACKLYTPSYISLAYILQEAGVVFQFDSRITSVSYLSRTVEIEESVYTYRRIKGEIMVDTSGITRERNINKATVERAFLDTLYLNGDFYFDNLIPLDRTLVYKLLPIYNSKALTARVNKILNNG